MSVAPRASTAASRHGTKSWDLPEIARARPQTGSVAPRIALESREITLTRVRRRLTAAGVRNCKSWEELFIRCDKNIDGVVDWREMKSMVRETLKIPVTTICDYELQMLFQEIDKDNTNSIDLPEMLEYIQHGPSRPQDKEAKLEQRMQRVQRNLRMAFQEFTANEYDIRKLFGSLDRDGNNTLSRYEFHSFVRDELGMSKWDMKDADVDEFYHCLDPDGNGLDVVELLEHVRKANKDRKFTSSEWLTGSKGQMNRRQRKFKSYKQSLAEGGLSFSSSLPNLGSRTMSCAFSELGRERSSRSRLQCSRGFST